MKQKKQTRRALYVSLMSLLLCCSMLVGTTFAWFTDSVTSGKNKLVAGNLDVELEYATLDPATGGLTAWKSVKGDENMFDPDALWEPGHTEVVYLRVTNKGTLALKYKLRVDVITEKEGTNVYGDLFKLSTYLKFKHVGFGEVEMTPYATREEAQAAAGTEQSLGSFETEGEDHLLPGESAYDALVVYMPTTVGNEANYRDPAEVTGIAAVSAAAPEYAPYIEMGVNVMAIQYTWEEDSFDDQYDKLDFPAEKLVYPGQEATLESNGVTVTLEPDAIEPNPDGTPHTVELVVEKTEVVVSEPTDEELFKNADGTYEPIQRTYENVAAYVEIALYVDGKKTDVLMKDKKATVTTVEAGLWETRVAYDDVEKTGGDDPTGVDYNRKTGDLSFEINHFGKFNVYTTYHVVNTEDVTRAGMDMFVTMTNKTEELRKWLTRPAKVYIHVGKISNYLAGKYGTHTYYKFTSTPVEITGDITLNFTNNAVNDAALFRIKDGGRLTLTADTAELGKFTTSFGKFEVIGEDSELIINECDGLFGTVDHGPAISARDGATVTLNGGSYKAGWLFEAINKAKITVNGEKIALSANDGADTALYAGSGGIIVLEKYDNSSNTHLQPDIWYTAVSGGEICVKENVFIGKSEPYCADGTVEELMGDYYIYYAKGYEPWLPE